MSPTVANVRFEHYQPGGALGVDDSEPRISWQFRNAPDNFQQEEYELKLSGDVGNGFTEVSTVKVSSPESHLVPWPHSKATTSRQRWSVSVRAKGKGQSDSTPWSEPSIFESGLLLRSDWSSKLISAPWANKTAQGPQPEDLFRREFNLAANRSCISRARLYITAQGVYEAEINGTRVSDEFLAPGWTVYSGRLQYQTCDVAGLLKAGSVNCLGVRVAEGWHTGRIGFGGGRRAIWASRTALLAQLEVLYADGSTERINSDESWSVRQGPIKLAEIYDGEKYDAREEVDGWSQPSAAGASPAGWSTVDALPPLPNTVGLVHGYSEPVRRVEHVRPVSIISTPSGKLVVDFGQNLVGVVRLKDIKGPRGHTITLSHAEVMEDSELGVRPLRDCKAQDTYTLRGGEAAEAYEPRFTFHGFRYLQIDNWPAATGDVNDHVEAIVCHTDMKEAGRFACSDDNLNQLFSNVRWSMRGNFLSVPTDCPQRDERLGWTGDLALFAPTASFIYDCFGILKNWLVDLKIDQKIGKGIPPYVCPNVLQEDNFWGTLNPIAVWHDVTVLAPWELWTETGDTEILRQQYDSMKDWLGVIPRNESVPGGLWDPDIFQLADWLDPNAPPDTPQKAMTDPVLVANAFLVHSLDYVAQTAQLIGKLEEAARFDKEATAARAAFIAEYVLPHGRLVSESQTAYALAICFDLLPGQTGPAGQAGQKHRERAGTRLAEIIRRNGFKIGTGFAGTPFVCEALVLTGQAAVAYAMLLNDACPSWLYSVKQGATTVWERWDSMLPDGSINPGEMTSFNHYALGAVATFLVKRLAGLSSLEAGWKRSRASPVVVGDLCWAKAEHETAYGRVSCAWTLEGSSGGQQTLTVEVEVPPTTTMEIVLPGGKNRGETTGKVHIVGSGHWIFQTDFWHTHSWPVPPLLGPV